MNFLKKWYATYRDRNKPVRLTPFQEFYQIRGTKDVCFEVIENLYDTQYTCSLSERGVANIVSTFFRVKQKLQWWIITTWRGTIEIKFSFDHTFGSAVSNEVYTRHLENLQKSDRGFEVIMGFINDTDTDRVFFLGLEDIKLTKFQGKVNSSNEITYTLEFIANITNQSTEIIPPIKEERK